MGYSARILKDSVTRRGFELHRLTTMEVTIPRIVLAEFNTHRMLSRNSASSRAIPVEKRIAAVEADPFIPEAFGKNQKGMQAGENLDEDDAHMAKQEWMLACKDAVYRARQLAARGVHKQLANRVIEPYLWHTIIVSGTEWDNYFGLRRHPDAQPEIQKPTELMWEAYQASTPREHVEWHLPLVDDFDDLVDSWHAGNLPGELWDTLCLISIGRCARVSYLTHDGKRDPLADIELARRLHASGHMSPFEHVARPMTQDDISQRGLSNHRPFLGNFCGWVQYRKLLANEDNFKKAMEARR